MKLISATIHKYKSFINDQYFKIEPDITCIVGKNESGKTAVLECLAKVNYFDKDERFKFDETYDYPKNEWKTTEEPSKNPVITLEYELEQREIDKIINTVGENVCKFRSFKITKKYDGSTIYLGIDADEKNIFQIY